MYTFNKDVFMPADAKYNVNNQELFFTQHAKERMIEKGIDINKIPSALKYRKYELIELTVDGFGAWSKMCVRMHYDNERDVCIVFTGRNHTTHNVKTVWLNYKTDKHETLNKSVFATESDWLKVNNACKKALDEMLNVVV